MKIRCSSPLQFEAPTSAWQRWNPAIRAASEDDENSISIFGPIGDGFLFEGVMARRIDGALRRIGAGQDVTVNINSPGGDMFEGIAIYNVLRNHKGAVRVNVLGLAASAASVIAMAGDEIIMNLGSMMMIHNPWGVIAGDYRVFEEVAEDFRKFTQAGVEIYEDRSGADATKIRGMLDRETWFNAQEAVNEGFADDVGDIATVEDADAAATAELTRKKSMETLKTAMAREGITRAERASILQSIGAAASVTGDDEDAGASVTASAESECASVTASLSFNLHSLELSMRSRRK